MDFLRLLTVAAVAAVLPIVTLNTDDIMDSPRPKAALSQWTDAPGRARITLAVEGATLRGYRYAGARRNGPVLVLFGGSGNLIERHDAASRGFARNAASVVWFDYRGYGFSSGTAHFATLCSDAVRVYDYVKGATPQRPVVVLGYSMGTAVAEHVAIARPVAGLILAAPWNDVAAAAEYSDPKHRYRVAPDARSFFDETSMVKRIHAPLLVFQGTRDDAIPPSQGRALERSAPGSATFVPIEGAKHDGLLENAQSQKTVAAFLTRAN